MSNNGINEREKSGESVDLQAVLVSKIRGENANYICDPSS